MAKLDIGCGKNWRDLGGDWEGLDSFDFGQKYVHNLEEFPYPISKNSIDEIRAYHVLEHIHQDKVIAVMNELQRILVKGGILDIKVPDAHYPDNAFSDPTHLSTWTVTTFKNYFCGKSPRTADYGIQKWASKLYDESVKGDIHVILYR